jgi:hypothetical protein
VCTYMCVFEYLLLVWDVCLCACHAALFQPFQPIGLDDLQSQPMVPLKVNSLTPCSFFVVGIIHCLPHSFQGERGQLAFQRDGALPIC